MILGTAQLGMDYGIHNTTGKPSKDKAFQILEYAWCHGISILDTAGAYGDSENLIGSYQGMTHHAFHICTKTVSENADELETELENSLTRLKSDQIWVYYLHRFDACKNDKVMRVMEELKDRGKILNIGISIYEPAELKYIIENLSDSVDVIQISFSILDCVRWQKSGLLKKAQERGIKLFARSVFLQGLLFQDPDETFAKALGATEALREIRQISVECSKSVQQLAVSFVLNQPYIEELLLGCETLDQIRQNLVLVTDADGKWLTAEILKRIEELSAKADETVIDPRKWNRRLMVCE